MDGEGVGEDETGRRRLRAGLALGALTGTAIAGYTLWDHHAVTVQALL